MATTQVKSNPLPIQSSRIASLRKAATSVLSNPGYKNAVWAGLTGPIAYGEQDESDDEVDVMVVWDPAYETGWCPHNDPNVPDLDDDLRKALGCYVYVRDFGRGDMQSINTLQALLASRTLYGSEKDEVIVKLRKEAREILENGITLFQDVCKKIEETKALAGEKDFEVKSDSSLHCFFGSF